MFDLFKKKFVKDVSTLATGLIIAQGITFLLTPIVARLYLPEHYGSVALFLSVTVIFTQVGSLRYEQAICLPRSDEDSLELVNLSIIILVLFCLIFFLLVVLVRFVLPDISLVASLGIWLYLLPFSILIQGLNNIFSSIGLRNKIFKRLALADISPNLVTPSSRIILGYLFGSSVWGLMTGLFMGFVSKVLVLFIALKKTGLFLILPLNFKKKISLAKEYVDFPTRATPITLLNSLTQNMPVLFLGIFFSHSLVGSYAIADRLVRMPVNLIGESLRRVYLQKCADLNNKGIDLRGSLIKATSTLIILGFIPFTVLFLWSEDIFILILGEKWRMAGSFASALTPLLFCILVAKPSFVIFVVLKKQSYLLFTQFLSFISVPIIFLSCFYMEVIPYKIILIFSLTGSFILMVVMYMSFRISIEQPK